MNSGTLTLLRSGIASDSFPAKPTCQANASQLRVLLPWHDDVSTSGLCVTNKIGAFWLSTAGFAFPLILGLAVRDSLPLHIARRVRASAGEWLDVIDHVSRAPAAPRAGGGARVGLFKFALCAGAAVCPGLRRADSRRERKREEESGGEFHWSLVGLLRAGGMQVGSSRSNAVGFVSVRRSPNRCENQYTECV